MTDLPTALRALADDQPLQPADRFEAVGRRARRVRRRRRVASLAAAVALLAPAGALALDARGTDEVQTAASSVLTWPDRSVPDDRAAAQGAIAARWHTELYGAEPPRDVRWLYRAPIRLPDGSVEYVAVFAATATDLDGRERRSVFVATADRAKIDDAGLDRERPDDLSSNPWRVRRLDAAQAPAPLGLYLPYGDRRQELLLLSDPDATSLSWRSVPLPGAVSQEGSSGYGHTGDGVFLLDVGTLTGPVEVDLGSGPAVVGFELGTPSLLAPARPEVPAGWDDQGGGSGQSAPHDESFENLNDNRRLPVSVFARCYGGGSLSFTLHPLQTRGPIGPDGEAEITVSSRNAPPVARGSVPCDGSSHRAFAPTTVRTDGYELQLTHDRLQAYAYVLATPP